MTPALKFQFALFIILVYRLLSYYSNSMRTLKVFLIVALLYGPAARFQAPKAVPCKTAKECYEKDVVGGVHGNSTFWKACTVHAACKCCNCCHADYCRLQIIEKDHGPKVCSSKILDNCGKDSVCTLTSFKSLAVLVTDH